MNTAPAYDAAPSGYRQYGPQPQQGFSLVRPLIRTRDWLDGHGRPAWLVAMIVGFVAAWPVGLGILGYMIWSKRMFGCQHRDRGFSGRNQFYAARPTGNVAFDAYRAETLKRLEDEHEAFLAFLEKLREAKDKAEFDQFMENRQQA